MTDSERLRNLSETLDGCEWNHPLGSADLCRRVAYRIGRLEDELTGAAEVLQSVLQIGEVKAIGLLEVSEGCRLVADEIDRLRSELTKIYSAIGAEKVRCPRCGTYWFVPKQFMGDPRFDCPSCTSRDGGEWRER